MKPLVSNNDIGDDFMGYNVLVTDDVSVNRKLVKAVIDKNIKDMKVYEADNGYHLFDVLGVVDIDLIILDLMMPEKDGFEVLQELKADEKYCNIPVIVNSALDDIGSIKKALELGAWDYFTKPLSPDEIDIVLPLKTKNALRTYEQHKSLMKVNKQLDEEMTIANAFQQSLIINQNNFKNIQMYGKYVPWINIGGDFYDCVEIEGKVWFIMADVTGHGVASAMVSTMIKVVFNDAIKTASNPSEVIEKMNSIFCSFSRDGEFYMMFTAFVGMIDGDTLYYSNAGHPQPLMFDSAEKTVTTIEKNDTLIGVFSDIKFGLHEIKVNKNNVIMLYTDGLYNVNDDGKDNLNWEDVYTYCNNFKEILIESIERNPLEFIDTTLVLFSNACVFNDDVALMVIKML